MRHFTGVEILFTNTRYYSWGGNYGGDNNLVALID
jgi:hypothetical protein